MFHGGLGGARAKKSLRGGTARNDPAGTLQELLYEAQEFYSWPTSSAELCQIAPTNSHAIGRVSMMTFVTWRFCLASSTFS